MNITKDTEKFIALVQQYEVLWKKSNGSNSKMKQNEAWSEIYTKLRGDDDDTFRCLNDKEKKYAINELKIRWKTLKMKFARSLKEKSTGEIMCDEPSRCAELLEFMKPTILNKTTTTSETEEVLVTSSEETSNLSSALRQWNTTAATSSPTSTNGKRNVVGEDDEATGRKKLKLDASASGDVDEADRMFLMSLLPQIRSLHADHKLLLFIDMINCIRRAKLFALSESYTPAPMDLSRNS